MEDYTYKLSDDELQHWGIKGMRWGVRRYQNKDGSLTPAGRKKYKAEMEKVKKAEADLKRRRATKTKLDNLAARKKAVKDGNDELDATEGKKKGLFGRKKDKGSGKDGKKSLKDMTDEELNAAINRSRLEQQYKQLHPDPVPKKSRLVNDVLAPAAISSGKKFLEGLFDKAAKSVLGEAAKEIDYAKEMKKIQYLNAKDARDKKLADEAAEKNKPAADAAARDANDARSQEAYERFNASSQPYNNAHRDRGVKYSTGRQAPHNSPIALLGSGPKPVTDLSTSTINTGKSSVSSVFGKSSLGEAKFNSDGVLEWTPE